MDSNSCMLFNKQKHVSKFTTSCTGAYPIVNYHSIVKNP